MRNEVGCLSTSFIFFAFPCQKQSQAMGNTGSTDNLANSDDADSESEGPDSVAGRDPISESQKSQIQIV